MLSIGLSEILIIAVVAILVVGPERLPKVMRQLGRWYGQLRRSADELRRAFVLEADRQDAEERYAKLRERRERAAEARKRAMEQNAGTVDQQTDLPPPDPSKIDREVRVAPEPADADAEAPEPSPAEAPSEPAAEDPPSDRPGAGVDH